MRRPLTSLRLLGAYGLLADVQRNPIEPDVARVEPSNGDDAELQAWMRERFGDEAARARACRVPEGF